MNVSVPGIDTTTILHSLYVIFGLLIFAIEINVLLNGQLQTTQFLEPILFYFTKDKYTHMQWGRGYKNFLLSLTSLILKIFVIFSLSFF